MDRILIKDLLGRCVIGADEDERQKKQSVVINLVIGTDLSLPGKSDRLADTIDYRTLRNRVLEMVENSHYFLIEALAEHIARICLEEPRISEVQVTIEKPTALRHARSVGVEISRKRGQ